MRRIGLALLAGVITAGCGDDGVETLPSVSVPAAERGPIALKEKLMFARVIDDDPLLEDLAEIARTDDLAKAAGIEVSSDGWAHEVVRDEFAYPYLRAKDRAALASYLGAAVARHAQLAPAEGHAFAYERVQEQPGQAPRWRMYLVDHATALRPKAVTSLETGEGTTGVAELRATLAEEDAQRFHELTEKAVGHKVAIAIGEVVVSAPIVREPISGGSVVLVPGVSTRDAARAEVERWAQQLRGG